MNTSLNNRKLTHAGTRGLTTLALALAVAFTVSAGPIKEGDAFPDLKSANLEGQLPDLAGKVVLVDFFASWCGPCKESFPAMQKLEEKYGAKGFVIVAVNLDKKAADMHSFLAEHKVSFTVVRDGENALVKKVQISNMPSSFILDRSGKVRFVHRGFRGEKTIEEYEKQISELLK